MARDPDSRQAPPRERFTLWRSLNRVTRWLGARLARASLENSLDAYRKSLIESGAVKIAVNGETKFQLRNGSESRIYVDHGELLCQPDTNEVLIRAFTKYLNHTFQKDRAILANVDSKVSPQLTGAIAAVGAFRQILVLPEEVYYAEKGTRRRLRIPNNISSQDVIVIIDDVLTPRDTTALDVAELVRAELIRIEDFTARDVNPPFHLVVGLVRDQAMVQSVQKNYNITVHWLATLDEVIARLWRELGEDEQASLSKDLCDI